MVKFEEDNLIYNRFDLIYDKDFEELEIENQGQIYSVALHQDGERAVLNVWGKKFPQCVFEQAVEDVFSKYGYIRYIEIEQGGNNYQSSLCRCNDMRIALPETKYDLLQRISAKSRNTLKRKIHRIEEQLGALSVVSFSLNIPYEFVELYFRWKKESHGIDYGLSPQQYLEKYHVTDAIVVKAGERPIGIIFFCLVEDTAYLENLSYDREFSNYSSGYITYVFF